jgi:exopolysaccharide biosynthesis polyprenyl glycosylphosphotransferase
MFLDGALLTVAAVLAYLVRFNYSAIGNAHDYLWLLLVAIVFWFFLLSYYGFYSSLRRKTLYQLTTSLINVSVFGTIGLATVVYFVDQDDFSRGLFLLFVAFSFLLLLLEKLSVLAFLSHFRSLGYNVRYLLIVGTKERARNFLAQLKAHAQWGLVPIGFLQLDPGTLLDEVEGLPVLGRVDKLNALCKERPIDEVIFCPPKDLVVNVEDYLLDLEALGVTARVVLDYYDVYSARRELSFFHDTIPILTFHSKTFDAWQLFLKRSLDIVGSLVGLCLFSLFLPFVTMAIKINDPGPIFFGQERVGMSGRRFKCWKFRSMYIDAEERKQELMGQNEMSGAIFKIKNDPRVTAVGRFLRKTSLDELPQFWNVLMGQMSLVGTRPPTPSEVAEYEDWHHRRTSIKPGITGMWQISGRNQIDDFDEIVRLDLQYIDSWNLWLDVRILLKTFWVVFRRDGSS